MKYFINAVVIFGYLICNINAYYEHHSDYKDEHKYPFHPYVFGYNIVDDYGNKNWRKEEAKSHDHVVGSYGFQDSHGIMRHVDYIADDKGFRAKIKTTEPGTASHNSAGVHIEANPVKVDHHSSHDHSHKSHDHSHKSHDHHHSSHHSSHYPESSLHKYHLLGLGSEKKEIVEKDLKKESE